MFQALTRLLKLFLLTPKLNPVRSHRIIAAGAWLMLFIPGAETAFAADAFSTTVASNTPEKDLVRIAGELAGAAQKEPLTITQSGRTDSGGVCVRKMDECYEQCKDKGGQPNDCNSTCTTDRICGMSMRIPYGQFLDFQIEMLAVQDSEKRETKPAPQNAPPQNPAPAPVSHEQHEASLVDRFKTFISTGKSAHQEHLPGPRKRPKPAPIQNAAAPSQTATFTANRDWLNWSGL